MRDAMRCDARFIVYSLIMLQYSVQTRAVIWTGVRKGVSNQSTLELLKLCTVNGVHPCGGGELKMVHVSHSGSHTRFRRSRLEEQEQPVEPVGVRARVEQTLVRLLAVLVEEPRALPAPAAARDAARGGRLRRHKAEK